MLVGKYLLYVFFSHSAMVFCSVNHKFYFTLLKFTLIGMDTQLIFHNSIDVSVHNIYIQLNQVMQLAEHNR